MMKFVFAPDSYKGSLTAKQAAEAMKQGVSRVFTDAEFELIPMADGGEGTVQSLVDATAGHLIDAEVIDPLGQPAVAQYGILGDQKTAVIEMSAASGIQFVNEQTHNPLIATTYGTGQLIEDALNQGVETIIIGIGGSATNDGGAGMAEALGVKLLDANNQMITRGGGGLAQLDHIDLNQLDPRITTTKIIIASDVTNPLVGPKGASAVFGPQKGATPAMVQTLDANLKHYAEVINRDLNIDVANQAGAGAAGGLGAGLLVFTNSEMQSGVDIVLRETEFKQRVKDADFVFTGEGGIDFQTQYGKTPMGVAQATKAVDAHVPVIALVGQIGEGVDVLYDLGIDAIFSTVPGVIDLPTAIKTASINLAQTAENTARLIKQTIK